jgi:DnaJ-class molecular chaperone
VPNIYAGLDIKYPGTVADPDCEKCKGHGMIAQYDIYGYAWNRRCPKCNEYTEAEKRWTAEWAA